MDSFSVLARNLSFLGTRPDSTFFRYSHGFYYFPVLIWTLFRYWHEIFLFREVARMLPFFDTRTDSTIFRCSYGKFFGTRTESFFSGNTPVYYYFLIHAQILPFSGTHMDSFLVLTQNHSVPGTRADSTICPYSHGFCHFPVLIWTVFRYSRVILLFRELARILPFFGTHMDSFSVLARNLSF